MLVLSSAKSTIKRRAGATSRMRRRYSLLPHCLTRKHAEVRLPGGIVPFALFAFGRRSLPRTRTTANRSTRSFFQDVFVLLRKVD